MIFYIYEVQGHKIGATNDFKNRKTRNFLRYQIEPIVIETMEGPDDQEMWQIVGDREWQLADELGYDRGTHYRVMRVRANHNNKSNGGRSTRTTTFEIAQEIKSKYIPRKYSYGKLAKEYNLSLYTIQNIVREFSYITP
tara:strand:+ start:126 stop:542 length:417 start_codon:yes stop_codon:yes gene_type:complete